MRGSSLVLLPHSFGAQLGRLEARARSANRRLGTKPFEPLARAECTRYCHRVQRYPATRDSLKLPVHTLESCHGKSRRWSSIIHT